MVYLIFNEGYAATQGTSLTRADLCTEALRLGRLVVALVNESEAKGLLALMLLHEARRPSRVDAAGDLVLLEDQNRSLWDRGRIREARDLIDQCLDSPHVGSYVLQAAIAAVYVEASSFKDTDWTKIVALYDLLAHADRSPVVALNCAVALAMRDGGRRQSGWPASLDD